MNLNEGEEGRNLSKLDRLNAVLIAPSTDLITSREEEGEGRGEEVGEGVEVLKRERENFAGLGRVGS